MIKSLDDLQKFVGHEVKITIEYLPNEMAKLYLDDECIMGGNLWDFYPGCHGGWHEDLANKTFAYKSPARMAQAVEDYLESIGATWSITIRDESENV